MTKDIKEEGVWFDIDGETKLLIASMQNKHFTSYLRKISQPYLAHLEEGRLDAEVAKHLVHQAAAKTILLDWKGLKNNGEEWPYTEENCKRIMTEAQYSDFQNLVMDLADQPSMDMREENNFAKNLYAVAVGGGLGYAVHSNLSRNHEVPTSDGIDMDVDDVASEFDWSDLF